MRTPLVFPPLSRLYDALSPFAEPMLRITAGLCLVPHGCQKLFGWFGGKGMDATIASFGNMSFHPAEFFAWLIALIETVGGLMLAAGFLTRPAAALVVGFMTVAVFRVHWPNGFFWIERGFEYPLMWGIVALFFVIRGGGRCSVDATLGREI